MVSFVQAWTRAVFVDGWLTESEARLLFETAQQTPEDGTIVEVGAYRGRSTALLAESGRKIVTVDPMVVGYGEGNGMQVVDADVHALQTVVDRYPNVHWLRCPSYEAGRMDPLADMIYIDGDHRAPAPLRDFRMFRQYLKPGGLVAFHDYQNQSYPGVTEAVDYLEQSHQIERIGVKKEMYVGRIPELSKRWITGLTIYATCHNFGIRGRSFIASLAAQQGVSFPIDVDVFYARERDQQLMQEGWETVNNAGAISLRFLQVPAETIMRRADLFATVVPTNNNSHVLYTDCDLWFPPTFFANYADELRRMPAGYWSSYVMDISDDDSRVLLEYWNRINEGSLAKYACPEPRYDWGKGVAGHFQCVQHELANYPPDQHLGVDKSDDKFAQWAIGRSLDQRDERRLNSKCPVYHFGHPYCWQGSLVQL